VHHEGDTRVYDTRTFYADTSVPNPETGEWRYKLALGLANEINRRFGYGMQVKDDSESGPGFLEVLHSTWMPAALTEASCIGHALEESLMAFDASHRQEEALGICDGYFAYADTFTCPQNFDCWYDYEPDDLSYCRRCRRIRFVPGLLCVPA
jgi:N-acetylmuramoyl-L-alanine amidase